MVGRSACIPLNSGKMLGASGDSMVIFNDTLPSKKNVEQIANAFQPERKSTESMSEAERQTLLWTRLSPVTQVYEFSVSDGLAADIDTSEPHRLHGVDPLLSRSPGGSLENALTVSLYESTDEDLAGLKINNPYEYLNEFPVLTSEYINVDLEASATKLKMDTVHYLWFSLPTNMREQSQAIEGVQNGNDSLWIDVETMVNSWLLVCLVRCRDQNIMFAMNLYLCLVNKSAENTAISEDLTDEARRHWYDRTMPSSPKGRALEVSRASLSSDKRFETSVNKEIIHLEPVSATNKVESIQYQTDDGVREVEPSNNQVYRCMVYGCVKRFDNERLLHNHLDMGKHAFMCPITECGDSTSESLGIFQSHISMQHQEQEWKLFLAPQVSAKLNSEFDTRQPARKPIEWRRGTASRKRQIDRPRTWDY